MKAEIVIPETTCIEPQLQELDDLELALVGGGIGDVIVG